MPILDTNFTGIIPYEEVKNSLEEIIRSCMNSRDLFPDKKTTSKIKETEDTLKRIIDDMDSCVLTQDYNTICAQLEKLLSSFDDQDKDLKPLKSLIKYQYNNIKKMELALATADLENKNRFRTKPLAVREYQQETVEELEDNKKESSNFKNFQLHKQNYIDIFNGEVLVAGSNRILNYEDYLDYQINLLIDMVFEAVSKYSEKKTLTSDRNIKMLDDISFALQNLLDYAKDDNVYQTEIIKKIEAIRQEMHQEYPIETLIFPEYQQVYTKLWTIAKQISCEYHFTTEEINGKSTDRYPLVWQVQSNLQPLEVYPHIINELILLIKAFWDEYSNPNNEKFKQIISELFKELSSLKRNSIPYKGFKDQLQRIISKVLSYYGDSIPLQLKGLLDCTIEFQERMQMLEIEIANKLLNDCMPCKNMIRDAYYAYNDKMKSQEEEASALSKKLSDETITLSEEERSNRANEVRNAWNHTFYYQMLLEGFIKKAEICGVELIPGVTKQAVLPKEGQ